MSAKIWEIWNWIRSPCTPGNNSGPVAEHIAFLFVVIVCSASLTSVMTVSLVDVGTAGSLVGKQLKLLLAGFPTPMQPMLSDQQFPAKTPPTLKIWLMV